MSNDSKLKYPIPSTTKVAIADEARESEACWLAVGEYFLDMIDGSELLRRLSQIREEAADIVCTRTIEDAELNAGDDTRAQERDEGGAA